MPDKALSNGFWNFSSTTWRRMRQTEKVFSVEEDDSNNFDAKSINEEANYLDSIMHYFQ